MTRSSSRAQAKLSCSISLYPKGFLLVKESLVALVNPSQLIRVPSLVTHLNYTRGVMHKLEDLNLRSRHEPQDFHQEPKSIGSVTQLIESPSIGWSVRHS